MQEYDLTRVHQANLAMLKEIDRICRKYKITYGLDAGTLLGAVRHQGFIPWDDDADVAFHRFQYEAFLKVARRELPKGMTLVEPDEYRGGKAFYDFTARIIYEGSQVHENSPEMEFYEGKLNHLWVDLFVIDQLPKGKVAARLEKLLQAVLYGFAMGHRHHLDYGKYRLGDKLRVALLASLGRLVPMKAIFRMQRFLSRLHRNGKGRLCYYSNYQPDYLYVTLQEEWCKPVEDLDFCQARLMAPKGWHQVLSQVYGDYGKLPPIEKQVPAHSTMEIQIFG